MNMNQTFAVLFWQTKSRNANGLCMVYAKVTINGRSTEISTNRKIPASLWNAKLQKAIGTTMEAKSLNNQLSGAVCSLVETFPSFFFPGKKSLCVIIRYFFICRNKNIY